MFRRHRIVFLFGLVGCAIAVVITCSQPVSDVSHTTNAPLSQKRFYESRGEYISKDSVCVTMIPKDFWEPGDNADDLSSRLTEGAKFVIDGTMILGRGWDAITTLEYQVDEMGSILGSWGGPVRNCLDVSELPIGEHTATIEVTSLSGIIYSYTWTFTIFPNMTDTPSPTSAS